MRNYNSVIKNLFTKKRIIGFCRVIFLSVFLFMGIQNVNAYYHRSAFSVIIANKVGDFNLGKGDVNMLILREDDNGNYVQVYSIPSSNYVFNDSKTECSISCNDGQGNCEYSFDSVNRTFSLTSNQKVTCTFHFDQQ